MIDADFYEYQMCHFMPKVRIGVIQGLTLHLMTCEINLGSAVSRWNDWLLNGCGAVCVCGVEIPTDTPHRCVLLPRACTLALSIPEAQRVIFPIVNSGIGLDGWARAEYGRETDVWSGERTCFVDIEGYNLGGKKGS